jgi:hypothetical protein
VLLPAGAYQDGDAVTDNRTRFALKATAGRHERDTVFLVRDGDGQRRIDPQVSFETGFGGG